WALPVLRRRIKVPLPIDVIEAWRNGVHDEDERHRTREKTRESDHLGGEGAAPHRRSRTVFGQGRETYQRLANVRNAARESRKEALEFLRLPGWTTEKVAADGIPRSSRDALFIVKRPAEVCGILIHRSRYWS